MATVKRRRPGSNGTAPEHQSHASDSKAERTADRDGLRTVHPAVGTRIQYRCPFCGEEDANATYKLDRDGQPRWFVGCWSRRCASGGDYLQRLGEALGVGGDAALEQLAAAVAASEYVRGGRRRGRDPEPLPTASKVRFCSELLPGSEGERWLAERRGIPLNVAEAARVGWDGRRLIFPMFRRGEVVAAKWRLARDGAQMRAWSGEGRRWPLYPEPEPGWWSVLLVAGELDALRARAAGLPACSVTLGAGYWSDAWTEALRGRRVVVCFDNNEAEQARERVAALKAVGIRARRLDLRDLGLTESKGDLSDYLNGGGSAAKLRRAMRPRVLTRKAT